MKRKPSLTRFARDDSALRDRKKNRTLRIEGCGTHKTDFFTAKNASERSLAHDVRSG